MSSPPHAPQRAARAAPKRARKAPEVSADTPSFTPLQGYFAVADGIAALFQPFVEAVVHDLHTDSVAYVVNSMSPRVAGDPSDLREVEFPANARLVGPYEKINWDGRRLKSMSIVLRDNTGKPIGLLCLNADVTRFDAIRRTLQDFLGVPERGSPLESGSEQLFHDDWHEKINRYVASWTAQRGTTIDGLDRESRRELIEALQAIRAFDGRRAPAYVAQMLGISRATVYNELARIKNEVSE
jgi:predicted transcriptional regulator YheO